MCYLCVDFFWENCFVVDEGIKLMFVWKGQEIGIDCCVVVFWQGCDCVDVLGLQEVCKGYVFVEGNQMDFVGGGDDLVFVVKYIGRVVIVVW